MKTCAKSTIFVVALLLSLSASALPQCEPDKVLQDYLHRHCQELPDPPFYVLAYDHGRPSRWWDAFQWSCTERCSRCTVVPLVEDELELRPQGFPRLTVPSGSRVATFVVGTNPLAYTVAAGASAEADHEDLADLRKLALLLGDGASSALGLLTATQEITPQVAARSESSSAVVGVLALEVSADRRSVLRSDKEATQRFQAWVTPIAGAVSEAAGLLKARFTDVETQAEGIKSQVETSHQMERLLRAVETSAVGELNEPTLHTLPPARPSEGAVHAAFDLLDGARARLDAEDALCPAELASLHRLIVLLLAADSVFAGEYNVLVKRLRTDKVCLPLETSLRGAASWFADFTPGKKKPPEIELALLEALGKAVNGYRGGLEKRDEALKRAKELLDKRTNAGQRASYLAFVHDRLGSLGIDPVANREGWICAVTEGVLRVPRAEGDLLDVPWNKVRTEGFTVTFDGNQKEFVAPVRPSGHKEDYELARRSPWRNFDVDLGLTHSPIVEPTYAAVSVASLGTKAPPEPTDPKALLVARTQEERRSGVVALFGTWYPGRSKEEAVALGWQLGLGLDTDRPAVFVGPTLALGRFFNLSGGLTGQEVEDLVPELPIGSVVNATTDVRTRKEFDWDWYVGLTLTLDDLPFFSGGD